MAENAIVIDKESEKEKPPLPPPLSQTPVSERPTRLPVLRRRHPSGTKNEIVLHYV